MEELLLNLFEPDERKRIIEIIRERGTLTDKYPLSTFALTLKNNLLDPIQWYIKKEDKKVSGRIHQTLEAAIKFEIVIDDIIECCENNHTIGYEAHTNELEKAWIDFQLSSGWDNAYSQYQFSDKQSKNRKKREHWGNLNKADREKRNQEIINHYKKTKLTKNSFAKRHATKYGLSASSIRQIIKNDA